MARLAYVPRPQYRIQSLENTYIESENGGYLKPRDLGKQPSIQKKQHLNGVPPKERYQRKEVYDEKTLKWKHPFTCMITCMIAGPTSCGKSTFTIRFLKNVKNLVDTDFAEIIYCAPELSYPNIAECIVPVRFLGYLPNAEMFADDKPSNAVYVQKNFNFK